MGPGGRFVCRLSALNHTGWCPGGVVVGDFLAEVSSSAIKLTEAAPCHTLSKSSDGSG